MEELLKSLNESDENLVKLFFIKKLEKQSGTSYEFVKSSITPAIGKDLKTHASDQVLKNLKNKIIGYDILPCTDGDTVIETLPLKDVPHLSEFIAGIADKNIKIITMPDPEK